MTEETKPTPKLIRCIKGANITVIPTRSFEGIVALQDVRNFIPDERMHFAMAIIEKHALIAGESDGEDSAGRHKMRRAEAAEIVTVACDISEKAFAEFERRGWRQPMPSLEELEEMARDNKARN